MMNPNDYKLTGTYYLDVTDMEKYEGRIPPSADEMGVLGDEIDQLEDEGGYWVRVAVDDWKFVSYDTRY